jgi:hypothetical protein
MLESNISVVMKSLLALVFSTLLVFSCSLLAVARPQKDEGDEAEKLLTQAEELTDIRSPGSHSFHLTATVRIFSEKGQTQEATYDLRWKAPTAWRDELRSADFSQVRVANDDKLFVKRKPTSLTLEMFQLLKLLEFPDVIRFSPEAAGKKLEIKASRGSRKRVLEIAYPGYAAEKVLLLDSEAPLPERLEYKRNKHFAYEFRDFVEFSGHQFPRNLIQLDSDKPQLEVKVQELTESTVDPPSLIPAPGTPWFHWCQHPEHAKRTNDYHNKVYSIPWPLRNGAMERPVAIYGIIGIDGHLHDLEIVKSAGKETNSFWMGILAQERYSPATCGTNPVAQEFVRKFP